MGSAWAGQMSKGIAGSNKAHRCWRAQQRYRSSHPSNHTQPIHTPCSPVLTTRPQPASIMAGSAALVAWKGAFRMTSMICRKRNVVVALDNVGLAYRLSSISANACEGPGAGSQSAVQRPTAAPMRTWFHLSSGNSCTGATY